MKKTVVNIMILEDSEKPADRSILVSAGNVTDKVDRVKIVSGKFGDLASVVAQALAQYEAVPELKEETVETAVSDAGTVLGSIAFDDELY